jgi:radical SAM superfamily enzyme YgiQ (UPF0313 family)
MKAKAESKRTHTLFFLPPGGYPAVANIGFEIVIDAVEKGTQVPCKTIRSDLFLCRFIHPELLNKIADLDVMDFFYADCLFPQFSSEKRRVKRDAYIEANGITAREKKSIQKALRELERYFKRFLKKKRPRVLAISLNSDRLITVLQFIRIAAKIVPNIRIILGGSALQGEVGVSVFAAFPIIDYLVSGRGEFVARKIIERIHLGEDTQSIPGLLLSRKAGSVIKHVEHLHRTPYPLPEMEDYYKELVRLTEQHGRDAFGNMYGIAVIQSVGCWWGKCDFCSEPDYYNGYFLEDCRVVAGYVHRIAKRFHISDIFFLDSIQPPKSHLKKLCRLLEKHSIPYRISSEIHACIDDETLDLLLGSGFKTLQVGIETYSQDLLDKMNKGAKLIDIIRILVRCFNKSVAVQGNLLMHHPLETPEIVRETIRVMKSTSHLFVPYFQHYLVAHGSPLFADLSTKGAKTYPLLRYSLLYPRRIRSRLTFSYRYLPQNRKTYALWRRVSKNETKNRRIEKPILMYVDGGESIQIIDTRNSRRKSYYMDRLDRDLIMTCTRPRRISDILVLLPQASAPMISESLERLVQAQVLMQQDGRYLTLATPWRNPRRESP